MGLDRIKAEIARMRVQIKRQQRDILDLQKAGIPTKLAEALLERMFNTVDQLIGERNHFSAEALVTVGPILRASRSGALRLTAGYDRRLPFAELQTRCE
jgi:hypothetical protein